MFLMQTLGQAEEEKMWVKFSADVLFHLCCSHPDFSAAMTTLKELSVGKGKIWNTTNVYQLFNLQINTNLSTISFPISSLRMFSVQFDKVPNDLMSVLPELKQLTLINSGLKKFPNFEKTVLIKILNLTKNSIERLSVSDIQMLKQLKLLELNSNKIVQARIISDHFHLFDVC